MHLVHDDVTIIVTYLIVLHERNTSQNLGVIYTILCKLDEAYAYCLKAIEANSQYSEAYNNLGVLYRDEGRITEAIHHYEQCLRLDPASKNAGQNRLVSPDN